MFQTKILVPHPTEPERMISLKELASILNIDVKAARTRYYLLKNGRMSEESFYKPNRKRKRKIKKSQTNLKLVENPNKQLNVRYVFRPSLIINGEILTYAAYDPNDLKNPVMDDIIQVIHGDWAYNAYDIGVYRTRTELVQKYLYIIEHSDLSNYA